jgi:hypothetical protein
MGRMSARSGCEQLQQHLGSIDHLVGAGTQRQADDFQGLVPQPPRSLLSSVHQYGRLAHKGTIFNLLHQKIGDVCP